MPDPQQRVEYLLSLLGKRRDPLVSIVEDKQTENSNTDDIETYKSDDSDYEDIISPQQTQALIDKIPHPSSFKPTMTVIEDPYYSETTDAQNTTEMEVLQAFKDHPNLDFYLDEHLNFITKSFNKPMPAPYIQLDSVHPFMLYWLANAQNLLDAGLETDTQNPLAASTLDDATKLLISAKITECLVDNGEGGIAGGRNQMGHVASTFAAVLALVSAGDFAFLDNIKGKLYKWFMLLKKEDGSFQMHRNGESDTRSMYCVLVVTSLLNIQTPELLRGSKDWITAAQTYEGGFAGIRGTEAHGGYSFCAFASYFLLFTDEKDIVQNCNLPSLIRWVCHRQGQIEGSLSGRTNKLVDACYSFWIGALFPMLEVLLSNEELFDRDALLNYILRVAQEPLGGFRDKPGKSVDFYHTNYTMCGLSICERQFHIEEGERSLLGFRIKGNSQKSKTHTRPVNPVYGLPEDLVKACEEYFYNEVEDN